MTDSIDSLKRRAEAVDLDLCDQIVDRRFGLCKIGDDCSWLLEGFWENEDGTPNTEHLQAAADIIAAEEKRQRCRACTGKGTMLVERSGSHGMAYKTVTCNVCNGTKKRKEGK